MKKILIAITAAAMLSSSGAWGGFEGGNTLIDKCESEDAALWGVCAGYIEGVSDSYDDLAEAEGFDSRICKPNNVTTGQLIKIVTKYLNAHPEQLHASASSLVLIALLEAFPCK